MDSHNRNTTSLRPYFCQNRETNKKKEVHTDFLYNLIRFIKTLR